MSELSPESSNSPLSSDAEQRLVQFSMLAVLVAMAGYAFVFGMFSWVGIRNPFAFAVLVLAVNFVLMAQDCLFARKRRLWAGSLAGAVLCPPVYLAAVMLEPGNRMLWQAAATAALIPVFWLPGILFGLIVGTVLRAIDRSPDSPPSGDDAAQARRRLKTRRRLLALLWAAYVVTCLLMFATAERWPLLRLRH